MPVSVTANGLLWLSVQGPKVAFQSRDLDTTRDYKVTLQTLSRDLKAGPEENGQGDNDLNLSSSLGKPAS